MATRTLKALAMTAGLVAATPTTAAADAGPYLAARAAAAAQDHVAAADWYQTALGAAPRDPRLLEGAVTALLAAGEIAEALPLAQRMREIGAPSQAADMVLQVDAARRGAWDEIFEMLEEGRGVGPLVDGLTRAWARLGQGRMDQAISAFDEVAATPGLRGFALYHKALALASVGDFEAAAAILDGAPENGLPASGPVLQARAQARAALDGGAAAAGEAWDIVADATEGLAELYLSMAMALDGEVEEGFLLLHVRAALALDPDRVEALLLAARLLDRTDRFEAAQEAYARVPDDHPAHLVAELGRAEVLRRAGETARALEVLEQLSRSRPEEADVLVAMGDLHRAERDFDDAAAAYDRAIAITGETTAWWLYYMRGIARHGQDDWPGAEADFRAALELDPDRAEVLNFLGYSLVERGEALDEALEMIERAVRAQPDSGAIVDSLGWAQFKLGRYDEAVGHLERAAELEPVDPIVNDHLGDGYWAVGRRTEARFQWQRALSFDPEPKEADRIRRKLEIGLDAVIAEEGGTPLGRVAERR